MLLCICLRCSPAPLNLWLPVLTILYQESIFVSEANARTLSECHIKSDTGANQLEVLVIEEISMVENQFLERHNTLMQHVLNNERSFGGNKSSRGSYQISSRTFQQVSLEFGTIPNSIR